jgi:hypothetical protein
MEDEQDVHDYFIEQAKMQAADEVRNKLAHIKAGERPYFQFTKTFKEALAEHREQAEADPETDYRLAELERMPQ